MPSLALFIQQLLSDTNNNNYFVDLEKRIDSLNHAQLQGMYDHLSMVNKTANSRLWKNANGELLVHVGKILDAKNKILAEEKRVDDLRQLKIQKKVEHQAAQIVEEQRIISFIKSRAREVAEKEVYESERNRETREKQEMISREPIAQKMRMRYIIFGGVFFLIACVVAGVSLGSDPVLVLIVILIALALSCFIFWKGYQVGLVVPLVVTEEHIEEAVRIRTEQLVQQELDNMAKKERDYQLQQIREREERRQRKLERKKAQLLARRGTFQMVDENLDGLEERDEEDSAERVEDESRQSSPITLFGSPPASRRATPGPSHSTKLRTDKSTERESTSAPVSHSGGVNHLPPKRQYLATTGVGLQGAEVDPPSHLMHFKLDFQCITVCGLSAKDATDLRSLRKCYLCTYCKPTVDSEENNVSSNQVHITGAQDVTSESDSITWRYEERFSQRTSWLLRPDFALLIELRCRSPEDGDRDASQGDYLVGSTVLHYDDVVARCSLGGFTSTAQISEGDDVLSFQLPVQKHELDLAMTMHVLCRVGEGDIEEG